MSEIGRPILMSSSRAPSQCGIIVSTIFSLLYIRQIHKPNLTTGKLSEKNAMP